MRRTFSRKEITTLLASLAAGLLIFYFGSGAIRNYLGDVIAIIFLTSLLGFFVNASAKRKALAVFLFASGLELFQLLDASTGIRLIDTLVLGSTFDPWDIVAYAVGATAAAAVVSRA